MKLDSIELVVKNNMCIGCGACAGVCPAGALTMEFNIYGEYNPVKTGCYRENCSLCLQACPFSEKAENENTLADAIFGNTDGIKNRPETGYYLDSYVGYSNINDNRSNGASGGMATWLLEALLSNHIVDYVVCVTPHHDSGKLFRFAIFNNPESIRHPAKSAYYPVEMSEIIKQCIENEGRYAITGLPCFIKALRLAARKNKKLRERIVVTIGLVCGQMKSKQYTSYLAFLAGVTGELEKVNYRGKDPEKPASAYFFHCISKKGGQGKLFWHESIEKIWSNRWFTPNPCSFCDDVFAELADVSLMDAWLPEYSRDWKGTNLVIVRAPVLHEMIEAGIKEEQLKTSRISIDKVIQSQKGILDMKRTQLAYRLYRAKRNRVPVPAKRVSPAGNTGFLKKKEIVLKDKMQMLSRELYLQSTHGGSQSLKTFSEEMNRISRELEDWVRIDCLLRLPVRVMRKLAMHIRWNGYEG